MNEHETIRSNERRADPTEVLILESLAKLDGQALGIALGLLFGLAIFAATNILIFKGGDVVGPNLALLAHFFIGYEVSFTGSVIGMIYGIITGLITGWLIAFIRNLVVKLYVDLLKFKGSVAAINDYIDNP
jgi:tetrahydromethanopterin S-methyltransferase subunit G